MSAQAQPALPRFALYGVMGLVGSVLLVTGLVPLGVLDRPRSAQVKRDDAGVRAAVTHDLRFFDRPDGAVVVEDASGTRPDIIIAPKTEQGFIRGVMRGLARERKMNGIGMTPPFQLTLWQNGRLSLRDSATGRIIELDSFGISNREAFEKLLSGQVRTAAR